MNKDDIKKALECCRNWCPIGDCPYYGIKDCENNLFKDTIELITEQEKEIEQLKVENNKYAELFKMKDKDFFTITVEDWEKFKSGVLAQIKQAKIDVLNELKEKCGSVGVIMLTDHDIDKMIEELKK